VRISRPTREFFLLNVALFLYLLQILYFIHSLMSRGSSKLYFWFVHAVDIASFSMSFGQFSLNLVTYMRFS
jgi:hypothetical protein